MKRIIYLTWDELMTVYNFPIPKSKKYLDRVRDVLLLLFHFVYLMSKLKRLIKWGTSYYNGKNSGQP
ncbi:MAG: hypothetical protein ACLUOS_17245 [Odoribacter splanchnicus]